MRDERLEELIKFDPIAEAERMAGKNHWSEFNENEMLHALQLQMAHSRCMKNEMVKRSDTYPLMTWKYLCNLMDENGFMVATKWNFTNYRCNYDEEARIWYKPGILIFAESYSSTDVNGGSCYYELEGNADASDNDLFSLIQTGSFHNPKRNILNTKINIDEGLFYKLNKAKSLGKFLTTWTYDDNTFWIYDYTERSYINFEDRTHEEKCKMYREYTRKHIKKCPQEVQDMVAIRLK